MKRLLVPTDFSQSMADYAMKVAAQLGKKARCRNLFNAHASITF